MNSNKQEFRVGDKVRVIDERNCHYLKEGTIEEITMYGRHIIYMSVKIDCFKFNFFPEQIERKTYNNTFENHPKPILDTMTTAEAIVLTLDNMKTLLLAKNKNYGDSALKPRKIFYKGDQKNTIPQRLDEKIARIENADELRKNDVADLIGYLTLICIQNGWTNFNDLID